MENGILKYLLFALAGYVSGSIMYSYLIPKLFCGVDIVKAVSYTHLDVYKRQISICSASTFVTRPECFASTTTPESTAALYSIPVPTIGLSVLSSGRCV